jgi:hypothetical protein
MDSGKSGTEVGEWDEKLLLQRLCEAFKKASGKGQKHVTISEFHEQFKEVELDKITDILNKQGVQKGIIEIDSKVIRPTPSGVEKLKELDKSFEW